MVRAVFENDENRQRLESMHPFRGLGVPEDLAKVCVFLASEDAQWVTGVSSYLKLGGTDHARG